MASSSSSSTLMMHHVFLSFRGEDTRLNFTSHLLEALKSEGLDVFFDEEKLEKGEQLSQALSRAIAVSNISIIVLSADYASSKSCLVELSDIMIRKRSHGHTVIPIFYHVDPSNVRKIGGSFETSFEEHESKQPTDTVQPWKFAFAEIGTVKFSSHAKVAMHDMQRWSCFWNRSKQWCHGVQQLKFEAANLFAAFSSILIVL